MCISMCIYIQRAALMFSLFDGYWHALFGNRYYRMINDSSHQIARISCF